MKNILAENLLRFGVKNLSDSDLYRISQSKLLKEEFSRIQNLPQIDLNVFLADPDFKTATGVAKTWIEQNKLSFNIKNAHVWLTICVLNSYAGSSYILKGFKAMARGNEDKMMKLYKNQFPGGNGMTEAVQSELQQASQERTEIQLNEHPDSKGMVLTNGTITATQYTPGDPNGASSITDIVTFMNDHNLSNALANPQGGNSIMVQPYSIGRQSGTLTGNGWIEGRPGKDPGAGALDIETVADGYNYNPDFYSIGKFDAATAKTAGQQITTVTFLPGEELTADLGKQLFKTGTITPEADMAQKVKEAVDGAKKLGTITAARIESGASFDRPINADNAAFAKMVGMAPNKVPADPKIDKQGTVTDPMSGGNAFLAHYRGIAIQNALGNQAGVTPTMVAKVEKGGDAAQYARIFFTVKKPDDTNTITSDDVKSIGKGSVSTDVSGQFKIVRYQL